MLPLLYALADLSVAKSEVAANVYPQVWQVAPEIVPLQHLNGALIRAIVVNFKRINLPCRSCGDIDFSCEDKIEVRPDSTRSL